MSVQATSWVWDSSASEGNARLVLLAIADAANKEGRNSCQSVPTIAQMCRLGERTVYRKIDELVGLGELVKVRRSGTYGTQVYDMPGVYGGLRPATTDTNDLPTEPPVKMAPPVTTDKTTCQNGTNDLPPMADNPINPSKSKDLHPINSVPQKKVGERKAPMRNPVYSQIFEQFWDVYPRQENKPAAYEMWKSATKFTEASTIIKAARAYKENPYREPKFTKTPNNWLSARGWEDGAPEEQRSQPVTVPQKIPGWVARDQANQAFANAYLNQQQPTGGPQPLDSNWIAGELA